MLFKAAMEDKRQSYFHPIKGLHTFNDLKDTIEEFIKNSGTFQSPSEVPGGDLKTMSFIHPAKYIQFQIKPWKKVWKHG